MFLCRSCMPINLLHHSLSLPLWTVGFI
ncbi:hypothetical protein Gohar_017501 [Gossypium harknessii]|uniref:Uncharacterized protein n=1 Tax=Gossypium harknessii TaxID=34285 RepID=A0A7J9G6V8_9ROSI|nr:hypothetical protein [Gossypium harknessii]